VAGAGTTVLVGGRKYPYPLRAGWVTITIEHTFESHDGHQAPPSGPARVVSSARTGGPDASSAPAASGPPAFVSECSFVEDALDRMVDQVFDQIFVADDVLADVGRLSGGHSRRPRPGPSRAALLDAAPPGPVLAARLASLELSDIDDHTLVEVLAAWERIASWAQAGSAQALGELLERTRGSADHEFAVDGVAARPHATRRRPYGHRRARNGRIPEVADAVAAGIVDRRKAEALVATGRMPDDRRREAVREVLPDVERLTVPQIKERMRRAENAVDPEGVDERREGARAERFVKLEPVDDAMAYLTAYLAADDAARVLGGWRVFRAPAGGVTTWTAPSGHRYDRPPTVADPSHRPPGGRARGRQSGDDDACPPVELPPF
jgi:hypothetical protein